ncbi:hypothetical protein V1517DRAFT_123736 [Lipomyces orientalis]|uniref:Uncharacterized protein n=1 Tax=Lipomyces orientalis TaxID=1233043 RepID=A0ACC3TPY9_9ASCO
MTSTLGYRDVENWSRQVVVPAPPLSLRRTSTASSTNSYGQSTPMTFTHKFRPHDTPPLHTSEGFCNVSPQPTNSTLLRMQSISKVSSRHLSLDGYPFKHRPSQEDGCAPGSLAVAAAAITAIAAASSSSASSPTAADVNDLQMRSSISSMRSVPISPMTSYENDQYVVALDKPRRRRRYHHQRLHEHRRHHSDEREEPIIDYDQNDNEAETDDSLRGYVPRHQHHHELRRLRRYKFQDEFNCAEDANDDENSLPSISDETVDTPGTPLSVTTSPDPFPLSASTSPDIAFTPVSETTPRRSHPSSPLASPRATSFSTHSTREKKSSPKIGRASDAGSRSSPREIPTGSSRSSVISHQIDVRNTETIFSDFHESEKPKGSPQCCVIM